MADDAGFDDEGTLVLEQRFAIVPEWIIDAPISDCAFRLYAVLLRYGQTSGQRSPWWNEVSSVGPAARDEDRGELDRLEARLLEADGSRVRAQQRARADLAERGQALSRLNVARRACELLDDAELTAC